MFERRPAITPQAGLWHLGEIARQPLGGGFGLIVRYDAVNQTDGHCFIGGHRAAGEYQIERAAHPDHPRQANRAAVNQGNSETPVENAEYRAFLGNSHVAPQRQFEPAANGVARYRANHRLAEGEPGWPHRAISLWFEAALRPVAAHHRLKVRAGTEMTAGPG